MVMNKNSLLFIVMGLYIFNLFAPYSPLHLAALRGFLTDTAMLLSKGDNVNAVGDEGKTPLHLAAEKDHVAIARLLLAHNAAVNV